MFSKHNKCYEIIKALVASDHKLYLYDYSNNKIYSDINNNFVDNFL